MKGFDLSAGVPWYVSLPLLHLLLSPPPLQAGGRDELKWSEVSQSLHYTCIEGGSGIPKVDGGKIHLLRFLPGGWKARVIDARDLGEGRLTVQEMAQMTASPFVINGGFFDGKGRPLGLLISGGKVRNRLRRVDWGVFFIRDGRPFIVHTRDYEKEAGKGVVTQAIQVGPRLVVDSTTVRLKHQVSERSALGIRGRELVFLITENSPLPAGELADLMVKAGCSNALNLDGGPSTQVYLKVPGLDISVKGGWPVPNGISMVRRE